MPAESFYCPFKFIGFDNRNDWLCEGRSCGIYDGRMHCCGFFSLVVMSKVFAKIDKEKGGDPNDPYTQYMRKG